jgi:DNA-binding transcriptional ArsR family regulator
MIVYIVVARFSSTFAGNRVNSMKYLLGVFLLLIEMAQGSFVWGLTIDEAYQAIPHKRTQYAAQRSTLSMSEREFLTKLFSLSDEALVERMTMLAALREGSRSQLVQYEARVTRILETLRALPEPASASGLAAALGRAIEHQRSFFRTAFASSTHEVQIGTNLNVRTASNELRRLYTDLMTRYGAEHPHTRDAFYQHLCSLDFL